MSAQRLYNLGVIDCDCLADPLRQDYVSYAAMFKELFGRAQLDVNIKSYSALDGTLPKTPTDCDVFLITGSKVGVYDTPYWMSDLRTFIQLCYQARTKLIGFCFGHQLLADVLGGKAEKSEKGWGIGLRTESTHADFRHYFDSHTQISLYYSHQDQVTKLPIDAIRLLSGSFCENAAYIVPGRLLGFQGHPEFTRDYLERLMSLRSQLYPTDTLKEARLSLAKDPEPMLVMTCVEKFLSEEPPL